MSLQPLLASVEKHAPAAVKANWRIAKFKAAATSGIAPAPATRRAHRAPHAAR